MIRACAWCEAETGIYAEGEVSHGICERHSHEMIVEMDIKAMARRVQAIKEYAGAHLEKIEG